MAVVKCCNKFQQLDTPSRGSGIAMKALLVNPQLVQEAGPGPAVLLAVLMSRDDGQGTVMTHKQIAIELGTNVSMARRWIDKLMDLGHLKIDNQIEFMTGQKANRYQFPSWSLPDPPAHIEQAYIGREDRDRDREEKNKADSGSSSSSLDLSLSSIQLGMPPAANADHLDLDDEESEESWVPGPTRWLPMGSPMPVLEKPKVGKKGPGRAYIEAMWLVSYMEGYLLDRENAQRMARGWEKPQDISADGWVKRKIAWLRDAERLLADHDVAEVRQITDWVFTECKGLLPFDVIDQYGSRRKDGERKVTGVRKLLENYDVLCRAWSLGKTTHTRQLDYRKPLSDAAQEASVTNLVATFEDFWTTCILWGGQEIHPSQRSEWTEQFRRLLDEHHLDVAELADVIDGLKRYRGGMDHRRYSDPRDLHRNEADWNVVRMMLLECREDEELSRRSQHASKMSWKSLWETGDDREIAADPPSGQHPSQDDGGRWSNEPWTERRKQRIDKQHQDAPRAAEDAQGTPTLTKRIEAALAASRTQRNVA